MVATTPVNASSVPGSKATGASGVDAAEIASNFTQFLQLLTTQLKNQDPLSPMDTNQFTQQLVEFSQVEQQMKTNTSLSTLVSMQQAAQSTEALALVGATVVVNGATSQLANGAANWMLNATKPAKATISIADSTGQNVYTGTFGVNSGPQTFTWDGHGNDGRLWPPGSYTLTASAVDASGQSTAISTQVQAPVDSVDLTQTPPTLFINGQNYTMNQLEKIIAH